MTQVKSLAVKISSGPRGKLIIRHSRKPARSIDYAISAINKQRRHGIKSMMCRPECVEEFNFHTDRFIEDRGVWGDSCSCG